MNKNQKITILTAAFFLVTGGLFAQNAQELRVGSSINGNLSSNAELWYSVRATQAGLLTVETTSNFDTVLEAYDARRSNMIAEDDDSGEGYNASLSIFAASGTTYMFKLRGYGGESGPFTIKAAISQPTELRMGTPQSASFSGGEKHWYSLRITENGTIIVETIGNLDTYMEAYSSSFELLDDDDDGGEGYNACVELRVTAGTTYYFMVRGLSSEETGPYSISASAKVVAAPVALRFGTIVSARLSSREEHIYTVRITEAGTVIVETYGNTDTYMEAYDSSNRLIAENDDGGNDNNSRIELELLANQTYTFKVRGYGSSSGSYSILASYEAPQPDTERNTERSRAVDMKLGEAMSVRIRTNNESRWYSYTMARTGTFVVQTRGNMDTTLNLYDSSGNRIADDDDSGESGGNARISERLSAGTYYIEVRGYGGGTGRCSLHAEIR